MHAGRTQCNNIPLGTASAKQEPLWYHKCQNPTPLFDTTSAKMVPHFGSTPFWAAAAAPPLSLAQVAEGFPVSPAAIFTLFLYTCESELCYGTNRAMRNHDRLELEKWKPFIFYLSVALSMCTTTFPVQVRPVCGCRGGCGDVALLR